MKKIILFFLILIFPQLVFGASLYFDREDISTTSQKVYLLEIKVGAKDAINTVSVGIHIPPGFTPSDYYDGNSIINLWVDKPTWDPNSRSFSFSGIIPGGFSGDSARLLVVKLSADSPSSDPVWFEPEKTKIYLNTPEAKKDSIILDSIVLKNASQNNISETLKDSDKPEPFVAKLVINDQNFSGKSAIIFNTTDKSGGINHYEVKESYFRGGYFAEWHEVESPYILQDQNLHSYIFIKAVDESGNFYISTLSPVHSIVLVQIIIIFAIISLYVLYYFKKRF